jgi:hypothetical protein
VVSCAKWGRRCSAIRSSQSYVRLMSEIRTFLSLIGAIDPDVVITIAFCFEFALFVLAAGIVIEREVRKDRAQLAAEASHVRLGRSRAAKVRRRERTPCRR